MKDKKRNSSRLKTKETWRPNATLDPGGRKRFFFSIRDGNGTNGEMWNKVDRVDNSTVSVNFLILTVHRGYGREWSRF